MSDHDGDRSAERVLDIGTRRQAGSFRFYLDNQQWEWSDEVARMHGYEPGSVVPTTELLLQHKHPDDRAVVRAVLERLSDDGTPFSSRHRIIDTRGHVRDVLVVADTLLDDSGKVLGTTGYYVDLTDSDHRDNDVSVAATLSKIVDDRAAIEQVKGMMMVVYGITEQQAFDLLQWRSQVTNTKLRTLAVQIRTDIEGEVPADVALRQTFDHLLLTAHDRARRMLAEPLPRDGADRENGTDVLR